MFLRLLLFGALSLIANAQIPADSKQIIVGLAENWDSSYVQLQRWEKGKNGWQKVGKSFPGRLGKNGLVWGLGLHPISPKAKIKKEGDFRAPAGIFSIGKSYATKSFSPENKLPLIRVQSGDLWVEDPTSKSYNSFIRLGREPKTGWENKQEMHLNDPAHELKIFIHHNSPKLPQKPILGAGSSIFFHIWRRDGQAPTAGCTTMSKQNLEMLLHWLNPNSHPVYVLLPKQEFKTYQISWKLP